MKKRAINRIVLFLLAVIIIACTTSARRIVFKSTPAPDIAAADIVFPAQGDLWYIRDGRPIEMENQIGNFTTSVEGGFERALLFASTDKFAIAVADTNAHLKFDKAISTFYTRINPKEMGIVRFTLQAEKNRRYVWVTSPVGADVGFVYPESDEISFSYAKMPNGIYKITLTKPLDSGEYGIIVSSGTTGYTVYSFSISALH